jgi:hypothetical protein
MSNDDDTSIYSESRKRNQRVLAWTLVIALVLGGGGAAVLGLVLN